MPRGASPDAAGRRSGGAGNASAASPRPSTTAAATARKRRSRVPADPGPAADAQAIVGVDEDTVDLRDRAGAGAAPSVDGRTARAERTRAVIVNALLSLLEEGDLMPTAHRVAERAGVSLRLIYHHFGDLESLFQAVSARQYERMEDLLVTVDQGLPLDERISALVLKRVSIYERMAPIRRASMLQEPFSPTIIATRDGMVEAGRKEIEELFAAELEGRTPNDRRIVLTAIFGALSWHAWNALDQVGVGHDDVVAAGTLLVRGALHTAA